jgi:hypothetical protein
MYIGMTEQELRKALGEPKSVMNFPNGNAAVNYSHKGIRAYTTGLDRRVSSFTLSSPTRIMHGRPERSTAAPVTTLG